MRRPIIAGNWKLNLVREEGAALVRQLKETCDTDAVDVVVCPTYTTLAAVQPVLAGSRIALGAQDVSWEAQGAFTGEVSAKMLIDAGCRYVIIGHSERRTIFGETDDQVKRKLAAALQHGLTPIVCIGETLAQRDAGQTFEVLTRQLEGGLAGRSVADAGRIVLAYEPVWAIGTGRNAPAAAAIRIQYGGSVTAANAAGLLQQPDVDGALVGGASLKADAFAAIVKAAAEAKTCTR
jgi:triosephosphate isomerase